MDLEALAKRAEEGAGEDRLLDAQILFALVAQPVGDLAYVWPDDNASWVLAARFDQSMATARSRHEETVEWQCEDGSWILMNTLRIIRLTSDIGAVVDLIGRVLPGWEWSATSSSGVCSAEVWPAGWRDDQGMFAEGTSPARALIAALICAVHRQRNAS